MWMGQNIKTKHDWLMSPTSLLVTELHKSPFVISKCQSQETIYISNLRYGNEFGDYSLVQRRLNSARMVGEEEDRH